MGQYSPIQARDPQGALVPFSFATMQTRQSTGGTNYIQYIGYARTNIDADEPAWLVVKQTIDSSGNIVHVQHAVNGLVQKPEYNQIWDNSTALTITAITKAASAEVTTSTAHGLETGDFVEIMNSDATEANSDGYGINMYEVRTVNATSFILVDPVSGDDINSSAWTSAGTEGDLYQPTYTTLNYA